MFATGVTRRKLTGDFDPMAEFKIPLFLNMPLKGLMNIERMFIKLGFSFPFGGSLLLVAKAV